MAPDNGGILSVLSGKEDLKITVSLDLRTIVLTVAAIFVAVVAGVVISKSFN